ncbi:hypothetical protein ACLOJK_015311 [Asimina triloba]
MKEEHNKEIGQLKEANWKNELELTAVSHLYVGIAVVGFLYRLVTGFLQKIEIKGLSDGFAGREITKVVASVQAAVYGSNDCVLDESMFCEAVDYKVTEHQQRRKLAGEGNEPQLDS